MQALTMRVDHSGLAVASAQLTTDGIHRNIESLIGGQFHTLTRAIKLTILHWPSTTMTRDLSTDVGVTDLEVEDHDLHGDKAGSALTIHVGGDTMAGTTVALIQVTLRGERTLLTNLHHVVQVPDVTRKEQDLKKDSTRHVLLTESKTSCSGQEKDLIVTLSGWGLPEQH